jgi:hypothetical protein
MSESKTSFSNVCLYYKISVLISLRALGSGMKRENVEKKITQYFPQMFRRDKCNRFLEQKRRYNVGRSRNVFSSVAEPEP